MTKLWRCEICGDPYIGDAAPANCPFCGAKQKFMKEFADAQVNFDVELSEKDRANAERALQVEVSNATFYFCAAEKVEELEGKKLFKILGKVEAEHALALRVIAHRTNKYINSTGAVVTYKINALLRLKWRV